MNSATGFYRNLKNDAARRGPARPARGLTRLGAAC